MRVYWKILFSSMIFAVAITIINLLSIHLLRNFPYPFTRQRDVWSLYSGILSWTRFLIYPVSFIVVSYFLGRNPDLKENLYGGVISLFVGCLIGHLIGHSLLDLYWFFAGFPTDLFVAVGQSVIFTIMSFLIGFSGLAIGYLRKPKTMNVSSLE